MPNIPTLDNSGFLATMLPVQPSLGAGDEPPGGGLPNNIYRQPNGTDVYRQPDGTSLYVYTP